MQKSDVCKFFITYPVHEFSFPFNFYECFLCEDESFQNLVKNVLPYTIVRMEW